MGVELGQVLREAREKQGATQQDVGTAVGVSRAAVGQWESGGTEPSTENLIAACAYLGIDLAAATGGRLLMLGTPATGRIQVAPPRGATVAPMREFPRARPLAADVEPITRQSMPKDVPVLGVAVGGSDGDFAFNGSVIDYARRPAGIAHTKDVYAIFVVGSSMSPRFEEGELVYVAPSRSPSVGDYVVVQLAPADEGADPKAFIKRLSRRTADTLMLEQFNPSDTLRLPTAKVASIHRVIPWHEVLGV